jgi:hypothetical protein
MSGLINFREMKEMLKEDSLLEQDFKTLKKELLNCDKKTIENTLNRYVEFVELLHFLVSIPKKTSSNYNNIKLKRR